jgi:hypothetical protein
VYALRRQATGVVSVYYLLSTEQRKKLPLCMSRTRMEHTGEFYHSYDADTDTDHTYMPFFAKDLYIIVCTKCTLVIPMPAPEHRQRVGG